MRERHILDLLDGEQRIAATAKPGPLLIVAGPGAGKTRTITCRIAYRAAAGMGSPCSALAVTHSTRAAGELRDRLARLDVDGLDQVQARTLHSAALRQLRHFWSATGRSHPLQMCNNRFEVALRAVKRLQSGTVETATVTDVLAEIEWAKTQMLRPNAYASRARAAGRQTVWEFGRIAKAYQVYDELLQAGGQLDFTDILTTTAELILSDERVAQQVRARYRSLYVDEYQDVDPAQQHLIDAWLGDSCDITTVGDPRQAVYGFKGASPALLATFPARYPGALVVTLRRDYRSTDSIVAVANRLAQAADPNPGTRPAAPAAAFAWDASHPAALIAGGGSGGLADVTEHATEDAEARWLATQVRAALSEGAQPRDIAVLYRFNAQSALFEQALAAVNVPIRVEGGARFFERPEVVEAMRAYQAALLRTNPHLDVDDDLAATGPDLLRESVEALGWRRDRPPDGLGASRDRWEGISALVALVEDSPLLSTLGCVHLLREIAARRDEAHETVTNAVTLATVHKAKGLEWEIVFCPGWVEGTFPAGQAKTPEALQEERRLAYVAVSRAKSTVRISLSRTRANRGTLRPSRFIAEAGFGGHSGGQQPAGRACHKCGVALRHSALAATGVCERHLPAAAAKRAARLRAWRTAASRGSEVPPYRLITDETLLHLAVSGPKDSDALAAVPGIGPSKLSGIGQALLTAMHGRALAG